MSLTIAGNMGASHMWSPLLVSFSPLISLSGVLTSPLIPSSTFTLSGQAAKSVLKNRITLWTELPTYYYYHYHQIKLDPLCLHRSCSPSTSRWRAITICAKWIKLDLYYHITLLNKQDSNFFQISLNSLLYDSHCYKILRMRAFINRYSITWLLRPGKCSLYRQLTRYKSGTPQYRGIHENLQLTVFVQLDLFALSVVEFYCIQPEVV